MAQWHTRVEAEVEAIRFLHREFTAASHQAPQGFLADLAGGVGAA